MTNSHQSHLHAVAGSSSAGPDSSTQHGSAPGPDKVRMVLRVLALLVLFTAVIGVSRPGAVIRPRSQR
jgi:hypothetical protein